jgi:glycerol-3-phosphate dehydrogenase
MKSRSDAVKQITGKQFDVCIIGGGATGTGCALDAQLRGLNTVLVEGGDFASATSSSSTKLVHGGVRYLQQAVADLDAGQYRVVKRALHERKIALQNAPFLAHPLELLVPCYSQKEILYFQIGMKLYDWISGNGMLFPSSHLTVEESARRMPMLNTEGLAGTVAYADGQFDDSRYNITLLETFSAAGGQAVNYVRVTGFEKDSAGKLTETKIEDRQSGEKYTIRAKVFVNATGPFSDSIREMAHPGIEPRLRLSKGVHILFPVDAIGSHDALLIPKTDDGRVIFAIPWLGRLLVGTTDDEAHLGDEMVVLKSEAEYLIKHLNPYLIKPLSVDQMVSGFAGVRPLVRSKDALNTKKLIRDHEVEVDETSGLVSVLGGKWTTYRAMAEDAVDTVQQSMGVPVAGCRTADYPLKGSSGWSREYWETLEARYHISRNTAKHLSQKFGTNAVKVLDLIAQDPQLENPIVEGQPPIQAEIVYGVRNEMAMSIEDILARRIGLQLYGWSLAVTAAPVVGAHLARELGWSPAQTQRAIEEYVNKINRLMEVAGLVPENAAV